MDELLSNSLPHLPGGWTDETLSIAGREFRLTRPAFPDSLLDDPNVQARCNRDGFMPYWAWIWPASVPMAEALLRARWTPGARALEIGSGAGLTGLAALSAGLRLTFSDHAEEAVQLALHNARINGLTEARGLVFDWRDPPAERFPVLIGCDVLYELSLHEAILTLLERMLEPGGVAWIGDPGRPHAAAFARVARQLGFHLSVRDETGTPCENPVEGVFTILELRRT